MVSNFGQISKFSLSFSPKFSLDHLTIIQVREKFQRVIVRQPPQTPLEFDSKNVRYFTSPFGPKMDLGQTGKISFFFCIYNFCGEFVGVLDVTLAP